MKMSKYQIKLSDLEQQGNVAKLERDGFTRETITKSMYKLSDGMSQQQRTELMKKLYDRRNNG